MNAAIYVDDVLIYDSAFNIQTRVTLQENSVYRVKVEGSVDENMQNMPVAMDLLWQSSSINIAIIPQFYVYDSADEIYLSPFSIRMA